MALPNTQKAQWTRQIDEYYKKGLFDKALPLLERLIAAEPRDIASRQRLIDCYERLRQKDKALQALLDLADFFHQDGRYAHAIATLHRALRLEPQHVGIMQKLADLLILQHNLAEAKNILLNLVDQYGRLNRLTKVLEVLDRLVDISPDDLRIRRRRAQVKAELGRREEALQEFEAVARAYLDAGQPEEALRTVRQAETFFPQERHLQDIQIPAYLQMGKPEEALAQLQQLETRELRHWLWMAQAYIAMGYTDEAVKTLLDAIRQTPHQPEPYLMLLDIAPSEQWETVQKWLHAYITAGISQGAYDTVWQLLERALERHPSDPVLLQDAVELLHLHHQNTRILALLDRAIDEHMRRGEWQQALQWVDRILQIDPDAYEYQEKRQFILNHIEGAVEAPLPPSSTPSKESSAVELEDEDDIRDYIQEQITEADVFYRYGMVDKAIQELVAVIRQYPLMRATEKAYQKLFRIYRDEGRKEEAIDVLFQYADFLEHHQAMAKLTETLETIRELEPNHPRLTPWLARLTATTQEEIPEEEQFLDISSEISEFIQEEAAPSDREALLAEVEFYVNQGLYKSAQDLLQRGAHRWPQDPAIKAWQKRMESLVQTEGPTAETLEEELEIEIDWEEAPTAVEEAPTPEPTEVAAEPETPETAEVSSPALSSEEIQDIFQDLTPSPTEDRPTGPETPEGLETSSPESPPYLTFQELLKDIERDLALSSEEIPTAEKIQREEETALLEEMLPQITRMEGEAAVQSFEDLSDLESDLLKVETVIQPPREVAWQVTLEQFKRKVEEIVPEEDAATHYNLGLAYLQMDLVEEAIAEFQKAARHRDYQVEAHIQLADCFIRKGVPEAAIRSLERVLEVSDVAEETRLEVKYMIACLYEQMGDWDRAYELYMDVLSTRTEYRDVADRIRRIEALRRQQPT